MSMSCDITVRVMWRPDVYRCYTTLLSYGIYSKRVDTKGMAYRMFRLMQEKLYNWLHSTGIGQKSEQTNLWNATCIFSCNPWSFVWYLWHKGAPNVNRETSLLGRVLLFFVPLFRFILEGLNQQLNIMVTKLSLLLVVIHLNYNLLHNSLRINRWYMTVLKG